MVKFLADKGIALGVEHFGNGAEFEDLLAVVPAEHEHDAVAHQYAEHAGNRHKVYVFIAQARNHAACNEGNVFGDGDAKAAEYQDEKHGGVAKLDEKLFKKSEHGGLLYCWG